MQRVESSWARGLGSLSLKAGHCEAGVVRQCALIAWVQLTGRMPCKPPLAPLQNEGVEGSPEGPLNGQNPSKWPRTRMPPG
jgi:hypothetical protein